MNFTYEEGYEFIPEFKGNKEKPKGQQLKLKMKYMGGADRISCLDTEGNVDLEKEWLSICESVINGQGNGKDLEPIDICTVGFFQDMYIEAKSDYHKRTRMTEEDKKK